MPMPTDSAAYNLGACPPAVILIVDDVPANLAVLHDALESAHYQVRVATDGIRALESARRAPPDLILLDALMPGLDGFETCRQLKADFRTRHIPVIFMTGLSEAEHVVSGFQAGGVDYVTKPLRPSEVLARIASHLRNAQALAAMQHASDAAGDAFIQVRLDGHVETATPLARRWLSTLISDEGRLPMALRQWLNRGDQHWIQQVDGLRLSFNRIGLNESLDTIPPMAHHAAPSTLIRLLIRQLSHVPEPEILARQLQLTQREAQVLYWVTLGKTNPEIAQVLELSPRTVNKHLEHIFTKLNVETRTAAATVALNKGRAALDCAPPLTPATRN